MNLQTQIQALDESTGALAKASSVREKVRLADRIYGILSECEKLVEHFVVTEIGASNSNVRPPKDDSKASEHGSQKNPTGKEFKDLTLAQIGKRLLEEHGTLHGSEIERRAKTGGFKSESENFQSYLAVAFKRVGGFENLGKNTWKLNPNIPPAERPVRVKRELNRLV